MNASNIQQGEATIPNARVLCNNALGISHVKYYKMFMLERSWETRMRQKSTCTIHKTTSNNETMCTGQSQMDVHWIGYNEMNVMQLGLKLNAPLQRIATLTTYWPSIVMLQSKIYQSWCTCLNSISWLWVGWITNGLVPLACNDHLCYLCYLSYA